MYARTARNRQQRSALGARQPGIERARRGAKQPAGVREQCRRKGQPRRLGAGA